MPASLPHLVGAQLLGAREVSFVVGAAFGG